METLFEVEKAFSRSLGWLTEDELHLLAKIRVGIVGVGGVGGQYLEILTRLGVMNFIIYDGDRFSIENTNRQNGCETLTYGELKVDVLKKRILSINPLVNIQAHSHFLKIEDVDSFCEKIDIYLDGIDFFELDIRERIFTKMQNLKKTAITVAPIGTGSAAVIFNSRSMSFKNYFGLHKKTNLADKCVMFLLGLTPSLQQARYFKGKTDFKSRKAPSLPMGVYSAAATASTILMKIVLNRGPLYTAPWSLHYDPYNFCLKKKYTLWGYRNPLQKIKFYIVRLLT